MTEPTPPLATRLAAAALILLALVQPLAGALAPAFGIGTPIGAATSGGLAPEQPMPGFFSIWSVIFLAFGAFGAVLIMRPLPEMRPVAFAMAAAGLANILWMLSAQLIVFQPLDLLLLFPIMAASFFAAATLARLPGELPRALRFTADAATGLLSGWISVALAISLPLTLRSLTPLGETDLPWPMFWLALGAAALAAWLFARLVSPSLWYFVALGWGLLGIAFNNWFITGTQLIGHVAAAGLIVILILRLTRGANAAKPAA